MERTERKTVNLQQDANLDGLQGYESWKEWEWHSQSGGRKVQAFCQQGARHHTENIDCQDAFSWGRKGDWLALAAADGISSCPNSREGAQTACAVAVETLLEAPETYMEPGAESCLHGILMKIRWTLQQQARRACEKLHTYGSALAVMLIHTPTMETLWLRRGTMVAGFLQEERPSARLVLCPQTDWDASASVTDRCCRWEEVRRTNESNRNQIWFAASDGGWEALHSHIQSEGGCLKSEHQKGECLDRKTAENHGNHNNEEANRDVASRSVCGHTSFWADVCACFDAHGGFRQSKDCRPVQDDQVCLLYRA